MSKTVFQSPFFSYERISQLGHGGGGTVWKVKREKPEGSCFYALKLINCKDNLEKLARFKNEFAFLLHCNHPNIIRPIDSGIFNEQLFYVMPLAESSLRSLIGKVQGSQCNDIAIALINALAFLHSQEVIHRDLKPENILMLNGKPQICDLGIAHLQADDQAFEVKTRKDERMANFGYAAPEQRSKNPVPTCAMDVYSLGVIIHELFTGEFIQGSKSQKIASQYPTLGYWDQIVDRCTKNDPKQRFSSCVELKNEFNLYKWDICCPIFDLRTEAAHFSVDRFAKAFPEGKTIQEFNSPDEIFARLKVLLRPPYKFGNYDCIWWTCGKEDNCVDRFLNDEKDKILYIGSLECNIRKIVSLNFNVDYLNCVYVETNPLNPIYETNIINQHPRKYEYFAVYNGHKISVQQAENGYYWQNNTCYSIDKSKVFYCSRFLTDSNFLILSRQNSIIQCAEKDDVDVLLRDILDKRKSINDLYDFIQKLPKPRFFGLNADSILPREVGIVN